MAFWHGVARIPTAPGMRLAMRLALITGQRIGEVTGIALRDLTLDSSAPVWIIPSAKAKNGKGPACLSRRSPYQPSATRWLRIASAGPEQILVFSGAARPPKGVCILHDLTCGQRGARTWPR